MMTKKKLCEYTVYQYSLILQNILKFYGFKISFDDTYWQKLFIALPRRMKCNWHFRISFYTCKHNFVNNWANVIN